MKKTASIFGKLSVVVILLFITTIARAKEPKSGGSIMGKRMNLGVYNPVNSGEWGLLATDKQTLNIRQVSGPVSATSVVIKNLRGEIIYNGTLKGGAGNIDISSLQYGKYGVYIQNKDAEKIYKLIIE